MKMGIAFQGILQRGLEELASTLPNGSSAVVDAGTPAPATSRSA
ncbi:MAG TPA: hypothetical protein VF395_02620 [Polyangiaceae bacterium]